MKIFALCLGITLLSPISPSVSAQAGAQESGLGIEAGDSIVFLGDSITHQALYTQYLETFFLTRYPDRRLHFHNAGVSGDRAADALARFDDDVAAHQPKVVTLLLGMNDGAYEDFHPETFQQYAEGMSSLLDRIEAIGARPIVLSPTMFDHHQLGLKMQDPEFRFRDRSFSPQYNALLAFYGAWLRERSGERGLLFADQWAPMNAHTFSIRRATPDFTLVPDAIHPAPAGHFLMAYELLWQIGPERRGVSSIVVTPRGNRWRSSPEVEDLEVSENRDRVTFTHRAGSLPWVVPESAWEGTKKWDAEPGARIGYEMTKAGHRLSNERLKIAGLAAGQYEIRIDGESIGEFSHLSLGAKIELQANDKTPQYQQALAVAELNRQRNDEAVRPLRDLWAKVKGLRRRAAETAGQEKPVDLEAGYEALKPRIQELQESGRAFEAQLYELVQPQARRYEIVRVPENTDR